MQYPDGMMASEAMAECIRASKAVGAEAAKLDGVPDFDLVFRIMLKAAMSEYMNARCRATSESA